MINIIIFKKNTGSIRNYLISACCVALGTANLSLT